MKKIINNRMYDTDTATNVGEWENMADIRNFRHFTETLYRKRTGEYFIHGVGNADSKYAVSAGQNQWTGGAKIIPLTYDSARKWAEENLGVAEYIAEFGEPAEDGGTQSITVNIPVTLHDALKKRQAETGKSMTQIVIETLENELMKKQDI